MTSDERDSRFHALFTERYRSVVAYFKQLGFDRETARDLAQDCFLRVYRAMGNIDESERAYLSVTARNAAFNAFRHGHAQMRDKKEVSIEELAATHDGKADAWLRSDAPSVEDDLVAREAAALRQKQLSAAVAELPTGLRSALRLRLRGLKYREVAAVMGISIDAVKARLRDARRMLQERLGADPQGFDWPAESTEDHDGDPEK